MKKFMVMATAGIFLLSLQGAQAQKEVKPPPVPPMLEGQRPLEMPESKETTPKKQPEEKAKTKAKTKTKAKAEKTGQKKTALKKSGKKTATATKKKSEKSVDKKKLPAAQPKEAGPEEG